MKNYEQLAKENGMEASRAGKTHAALWHNMQVPQFGRVAEMVWGGQVAVMPDHAVFAAAKDASKRAKSKIAISVEVGETPAGKTVYRVGTSVLVTVG